MMQERILKHRMQQLLIQAVCALFVASLTGPGLAQGADYKIGFVNSERLFRDAAPAKRAQQKLEKEFAGRDAPPDAAPWLPSPRILDVVRYASGSRPGWERDRAI